MESRKKIVVLGAGYAGLSTVRTLQKNVSVNEAEITLINKNSYHYGTTLLHETSAGNVSGEKISFDIASVLNTNKVNFVQAEVEKIDIESKKITTTKGEFNYDILVMALGFVSETFGIEGMQQNALQIEDLNSSLKIAEHIENQFKKYSEASEKKAEDLTILVGGAGFTGVELLGELAERIPVLCKKYGVSQNEVKVICVEAAPRMLPMFDEETVKYVVDKLEAEGIEFKIGTKIVGTTPTSFKVEENGEAKELVAGTLIWAAGVRGCPLMDETFEGVVRGRIIVESDLTIKNHPEIYVLGDCAAFIGEGEERPYPTTAQIALQMGVHAAKNISNNIKGQSTVPFKYNYKGTLCSLGQHDAVAAFPNGKKMHGTMASLAKKAVETKSFAELAGFSVALKKNKFF